MLKRSQISRNKVDNIFEGAKDQKSYGAERYEVSSSKFSLSFQKCQFSQLRVTISDWFFYIERSFVFFSLGLVNCLIQLCAYFIPLIIIIIKIPCTVYCLCFSSPSTNTLKIKFLFIVTRIFTLLRSSRPSPDKYVRLYLKQLQFNA